MHRPSVAEVTQQHDAQSGEGSERLVHGGEVEQRLARVLPGSVPGVDDRFFGDPGGQLGRPLVGVAEHDRVGVAGEHSDRVGKALALAHGGRRGVRDRDARAPEALHGRLEREPGTSGRLEEPDGDDAVGEGMHHLLPLRVGDHFTCGGEEREDLLLGKVPNGDQVASPKRHPGRGAGRPLKHFEAARLGRKGSFPASPGNP